MGNGPGRWMFRLEEFWDYTLHHTGMERHPQHKVQDDLYDKAVGNLKELNANVERMNQLLVETNRTNETAVLVSQLNSTYLDGISFQLDLQKKDIENNKQNNVKQ